MRHKIISGLFLILLSSTVVYAQYHALFRFDASLPVESPFHSQVTWSGLEFNDYLEPAEVIARGPDGWGLSLPRSAHFLNDSSAMVSDNEAIISFFGNHTITGEMWIKPDSLDGTIISWGDSAGVHFITTFLQDGFLNIHRYLSDSLFTMTATVPVDTASWSYLYWINRIINGYIEFELYVDGTSVFQQSELMTVPAAFTLIRSQVRVGRSSDPRTFGPSFKGQILGISLNNYLRSETYLQSSPPFDGSEYFGMPLYLERGSEKVVTVNPTEVERTVFVPYSNDFYIPQGMASTFEDKQHPTENDMVYLAMYHKDINGTIGGKNSIIVEMDPNKGYQVRRCFQFTAGPTYGHLPAMAFYASNLYVGSEGSVYQCEVPAYDSTAGKYFDLEPINTYNIYSSNLNYFDDTLWVASWGARPSGRAFMFGYPVYDNGNINIAATPVRYEIPNTNQGAAWTEYGGEKYLFVCTSWGGTNNSLLYRYRKGALQPATLITADRIFEIPSGGEDITFDDANNMINVSESSARAYQLRDSSPWNQFYPFVFEISPDVLFSDVDTSSTGLNDSEKNALPEAFTLSVYPNPFNDSTIINYTLGSDQLVSLDVFDLQGRQIETIIKESHHSQGQHQLAWSPQVNFSGVYLLNFRFSDHSNFSRKIVYLK
ncbi:MAG: T9SS type A sorting domain-containing protein [Candidatus Marinimicrobia bacterium]|nr:T9SS type A sorting domain-containing protein [Candidatus Neomarinimicrobiota bacterium]